MASDSDKKILDIKTGHTAEATSRPVIVTNRTMVRDSTVKDDDKPAKEEDKLVKSESKPLQPLSKELEPTTTEDAPKDIPADEEEANKQKVELSAEDQSRQETIAKLISSGKYVVPIGHIERNQRLRKLLPIIVLILLITLVGAWFLFRTKH